MAPLLRVWSGIVLGSVTKTLGRESIRISTFPSCSRDGTQINRPAREWARGDVIETYKRGVDEALFWTAFRSSDKGRNFSPQ